MGQNFSQCSDLPTVNPSSSPTADPEKSNNFTSLTKGELLRKKNKETNQYLNDPKFVQMPYYDSDRWITIYQSLSTWHNTIETSSFFDKDLIEKTIFSYNSEFIDVWNFSILYELIEKFDRNNMDLKDFMLNLINLALNLPTLMHGQPIPILSRGSSKHVTLDEKQCSSILANAFLCTFPICENRNLSSINLNKLFCTSRYDEHRKSRKIEKLKCLINYLKRTFEKDDQKRKITFVRKVFTHDGDYILGQSNKDIIVPEIWNDKKIEDFTKVIEVDFANKHIGGGVLGTGCVQEEIRFVLSPELIVSLLFCETLDEKETIIIQGAERFNDYEGYSDTFKWKSNYVEKIENDEMGRLKTFVVAMDAIEFKDRVDQFRPMSIIREVDKCFSGFNSYGEELSEIDTKELNIVSGHWGCGVFNGDKEIKFLIQLLVSSALNKKLIYCTFGDSDSDQLFQDIISIIIEKKIKINKVYAHLLEYCEFKLFNFKKFNESINFFDFLKGKK